MGSFGPSLGAFEGIPRRSRLAGRYGAIAKRSFRPSPLASSRNDVVLSTDSMSWNCFCMDTLSGLSIRPGPVLDWLPSLRGDDSFTKVVVGWFSSPSRCGRAALSVVPVGAPARLGSCGGRGLDNERDLEGLLRRWSWLSRRYSSLVALSLSASRSTVTSSSTARFVARNDLVT